MRNTKQIYWADSQRWVDNGLLVQPLFSYMADSRCTSPSLMLDYTAPYESVPNETHGSRDVGQHLYKGFETVTIAYRGEMAHRDSNGGDGIIYEGDMQWTTAGSGITHEELYFENFSEKDGLFEMVQLQVSLPTKDKNTPPRYRHLTKANIPVVKFLNETSYLRLIAGEHDDVKSTADAFAEMNVWDIVPHVSKEAELEIPDNHSPFIVVLHETATLNSNEQAATGKLVNFEQTGGKVCVKAGSEGVKILLFSDVPIDEPVVGYNPFVMNTAEEIRQAVSDFKSGKFGRID